jgi:hypothetical protein
MKLHSAPADKTTAADVATTDGAQDDRFLRVLSQMCRRTNLRIDMYQRGIAVAEARGDVGYACAFRHLTHIDEHDRQLLQSLIDRLQQRSLSF